jgi:serine protease AprX
MNNLTTLSRSLSCRRTAQQIGAIALLVAVASSVVAPSAFAAGPRRFAKLDEELNRRAASAPSSETTSVIVGFEANQLPPEFRKFARSFLPNVDRYVLDVPNAQLKTIGEHASTIVAGLNGTVRAFNFRTSVQSGAFFAQHAMGFTGAGVGVAVIDSGISPNEEFAVWEGMGRQPGRSRVTYFQDFLVPDQYHTARTDSRCATPRTPCDPNGHGTHVTGTIAGNGFDSFGAKSGMAPDASIIALRVLGIDGTGKLDGVISALDWVLRNHAAYKIRVVNLSFGMVPQGSLPDSQPLATMLDKRTGDPLAIATKRLVDAGIFVVAAAGNVGQIKCADLPSTAQDHDKPGDCDVWGGITAPGTYPWVFTAGANSSEGSFTRTDDIRAKFSSRGPAFPLQNAKPDMLAGGRGIESTSAPGSMLYQQGLGFLLGGASTSEPFPYMALTGTSQAAAVVSGVAAQMLQANPTLTPNFIKAILQYTSQEYEGYTPLEQGAGFLNALGAVRLSNFYATARKGQRVPVSPIWSQHFIWGNHQLSGGLMLPKANAWNLGVMWGMPKVSGYSGDNIVWGTACGDADCGDNIVWGTSGGDNIVWGTADDDNIVWGTSGDGDNIVWGTAAGDDNIVWGTDCGGQDCGDNIVWGTAADGDDNIVWGTASDGDNIVWGTAADGGDNIVWGTAADGDDNIVWGTVSDDHNIVWATAADADNIVWGTLNLGDNIVWGTTGAVGPPNTEAGWYQLFLNRRIAAWWMSQEFGDSSASGDRRGPKVSEEQGHTQRSGSSEPPKPPRGGR